MTPPRRAVVLYSQELEEGLLGSMMLSAEVCTKALEALTTEDFGSERTRCLFGVVRELGSDVDALRVSRKARERWPGDPGEVAPYVHTLVHEVASPRHGLALVDDMLQVRARRQALDASELLAKAAESEDPEVVLHLARTLVAPEPSRNGHERVTAAWLLEQDFPDPVWIVPEWLSEGLCMFGGRPKVRKSFMMLQLCMAKAMGGVFLGRRLRPAPVVYFALEDGKPRLAKRLRHLECPRGVEGLHFQVTMPPLDQGGVEHVEATLEATGAELVVIDTLESSMVGTKRSKDHDVNAHLTELLRPYQRLALDRHIAIVFVDHLRKPGMNKRNLINDVMGGTAKVAVADTIWGLWREDGETRGEFQMKGRDVEEMAHLLEWRPTPLAWQYVGDLEEASASEADRRYVDAVRELGPEVDSRAVAEFLSVTPQAAQDMLRKLREGGKLTHEVKTTPKGGRTFLYSVLSRSALVAPKEGDETWAGEWWQERAGE
jgi:AAA domain/DnaB-like helicase N terminal domain